MTNVFVFMPSFRGQITATAFESSHALMSAFMSKGIHAGISTYSWPDIAEIRNVVLSIWYDTMPNSTHLLMLDDDMGYSPQMVLDMLAFGEPMVGAAYPKRTLPIVWAGSGLGGPDKAQVRGGFMEVEALGMGCFLIRRDAVTAMIEKFPELIADHILLEDFKQHGAHRTLCFFDEMRAEKGKVSEDISFCRRYRQTGGNVWASIAYEMTHVGAYAYQACFAKWSEQAQKDFDASGKSAA